MILENINLNCIVLFEISCEPQYKKLVNGGDSCTLCKDSDNVVCLEFFWVNLVKQYVVQSIFRSSQVLQQCHALHCLHNVFLAEKRVLYNSF